MSMCRVHPNATEPVCEAAQWLQGLGECRSCGSWAMVEAFQRFYLYICVTFHELPSSCVKHTSVFKTYVNAVLKASKQQSNHFRWNNCTCVSSPNGYRTNVRCNSIASGQMWALCIKLHIQCWSISVVSTVYIWDLTVAADQLCEASRWLQDLCECSLWNSQASVEAFQMV